MSMSKCIKLSDYLDLLYFKSNYIVINKFINSRLRRYEKIGRKRTFYLEEILKMLDANDDYNKTEYIVNLKTKIELLLVKEENKSYFEYISYLLEKDSLTENDIISFIALIDNKKYLLKKLVSKVNNISSFNNMTLNIIKDRISDDGFIESMIYKEKKAKAERLVLELKDLNDDSNVNLDILKTKYTELFDILKTTSLDINSAKILVITINEVINKIQSFYHDCSDLIEIINNIKNIIGTVPINKITSDVINNSLNIDLGMSFNGKLNYNISNSSFIHQDTPIIALDKESSLDLDSAFSIDKDNDLYYFDVYVTNVPSFLGHNRDLSINSYKQGTSFYLRDKSNTINYDMLPANLSHDYLSMLSKDVSLKPKDAIVFHFVIDKNGIICSSSVNRNKVLVDYNLTSYDASRILNKEEISSKVDKSIYLLRDLCKTVSTSSTKQYLSNLSKVTIDDMIAFPSVSVNYYLADELKFGIYRENGVYTSKPVNDIYLTGSAPLRRYVDDINLAILLEQKGLQSFNKDDFRYLENNFDEIIEHLNEQNFLDKYIENNNALVKKYYLKRD